MRALQGLSCFKWLVLTALTCLSISSHAALFGDDEARRAILDLRQKLEATQQRLETTQQRLEATQQSVKSQSEETVPFKRALLDLQNQIESLKSEQAGLRGSFEQVLRDLTELQLKQKDILQTLDARLSKFEPTKIVLDGLEFQADPAEKRQFESALAVFRTGDFAAAQNSLLAFLLRYPSSGYASSALFWLGNAQFVLKNYPAAVLSFRKMIARSPGYSRVPEAWLAIANCQLELKEAALARKTLEDLVANYGQSEAADIARERLSRMKQ